VNRKLSIKSLAAFGSLWSADLLTLRSAIDALSGHADEFHLDVMDGNCVPEGLQEGPQRGTLRPL
jgi:pentose-5-phosphate-3-epimerase